MENEKVVGNYQKIDMNDMQEGVSEVKNIVFLKNHSRNGMLHW